MSGEDWNQDEVRKVVADYFTMLALDLAGQPYNKTKHREQLRPKLSERSSGSIEFKHGNISAVLLEAGFPYIPGYKPRHNYQDLLAQVALEQLQADRNLHDLAVADVDRPTTVPEVDDLLGVREDPPKPELDKPGRTRTWVQVHRPPTDYLAREAQNRSLGAAGEEFIMKFERARLTHSGRENLADRVQHISRVHGDQVGFDILSYDEDGAERLIEVKTTKYGDRVPFFVSRNELQVSEARAEAYHVYRLHSFRDRPRLFVLSGPISTTCQLDPATYVARLRGLPQSAVG